MFTAVLFTIAKTCPSIDEWIKKTWYIYTMKYYSAIKMNEMMPFATTWLHLEIISRLNQAEKEKYHIDITYMCNLKKIYK